MPIGESDRLPRNLTMTPRVYITRQIPQKGLDLLLGKCNVCFWEGNAPAPRSELLLNVQDVDVLLCMPTDKIDAEVLDAAGPSLKIVATMSEDSDHIDAAECSRRQIQLLTIPKVSKDTVADLAIGLLLMTTRQWINDQNNLNAVLQSTDVSKELKKDKTYGMELSNRVVGIISFGALGLAVARKLKFLGCSKILYTDSGEAVMAEDVDAKFVDRATLLRDSDIICACNDRRSSDSSSTVFNKDDFSKMKSSAVVIDATKGVFANFADLYDALRNGEITAVGLDVREYDVIPNRHPLGVLDNCYFLPYRECHKWDGRGRLSRDLAECILQTMQT